MYEKDLKGKTILKAEFNDNYTEFHLQFTDGTECHISPVDSEISTGDGDWDNNELTIY